MTIREVQKAKRRVDTALVKRFEITAYGVNNLYPQELRNIINASRNGRTCVERKAIYVEGNGLSSQFLSDFVCNAAGEMVDDVHHLVAEDVAYYDGFALHVNYDAAGRIVSLAHIPFEQCRLGHPDSKGVVRHIAIHPDWVGDVVIGNKRVALTEENIVKVNTFDPRPAAVLHEMEAAGGIENYLGQVLYVSRAGRNAYPTPLIDVIITDMSTDEGLATVSHRNTRCNFQPAGMLVLKRGQGANAENDDTAMKVAQLQGDERLGKILVAEIETAEDRPEFVSFAGENYDKAYTETTAQTIDNIYAVFNQEGFARLRSGSIGFTGDLISDVKLEYCQQVKRYQRMMSRAYKMIFDHWAEGLPYRGIEDVNIEPLYKATETV